MFNWAKQQLANVAGTAEPIYGPEAIQPVSKQAENTPFTELKKDDMKWIVMDSTCVETQTFYFMSDAGPMGMAQIIYSNVAGIRTTAQFSAKIFYQDGGKTPHLWSTDALNNYGFSDDRFSFYADNVDFVLSDDGTSYTIKANVNPKCAVDVKVTLVEGVPGFMAGKNGTSAFGTNPQEPWGWMRHTFWPRCKVEGKFMTQNGDVDMTGRGLFIHALQGMKPHHAAARWNFANFHSPTYSAVMMEFTTPPSYGSTTVTVGAITTDAGLVLAGASPACSVVHEATTEDPENEWPEPTAATYKWTGKTVGEGKPASAVLDGSLGDRLDRVDVMAEVPRFVKQIVAGAAGTKPYIYQFAPKKTLKLKIGDEEKSEEGLLFTEATFIS
ncbi:oxidative stress survival, Svf1-like protein [Lineolata rhizophorae]|uniref:Oxidative stress survival, Svf1-like protein n=1 Tax=Lineolata rhizophorae TaxID=578093 RepID=A0A6A6P4K8_9PEZI|nr:oxidative stress survival, Svf1-like protein [Lineolata rhizophorae]